MNMLQNSSASLWEAVSTNLDACDPFLSSAEMSLALRDLLSGSVLGGRCQELSGCSCSHRNDGPAYRRGGAHRTRRGGPPDGFMPPDMPVEYLPSIFGPRKWMQSFLTG